MNNTSKDYIIYSGMHWDFIKQRPQLIAQSLSKKNRVLYVECMKSISAIIKDKDYLKPDLYTGKLRKINENLYVFRPPFNLPVAISWKLQKLSLQKPLDYFQQVIINNVLKKTGFNSKERIGICTSYPMYHYLAGNLDERIVIYDCVDDHLQFPEKLKKKFLIDYLAFIESEMIKKSDFIIATAEHLSEKMRASGKPVYKIPNATSSVIKQTDTLTEPEDISKIPHPRAGYIGCLSDWFDLDMLDKMSAENSDINFILIGPTNLLAEGAKDRFDNLIKRENIHYLGVKDYSLMSSYIGSFDVGIIPFIVNDLIKSCNPVKAYDYLSLGKPVISTYWDELKNFEGYLSFANDAEGFAEKIKSAINEDSSELKNKRKEFAQKNTWDTRAEELDGIAEQYLQAKITISRQ